MSGLGRFGKVLFFFLIFKFIYLGMLGLSCSMQILSCGMWDLVPSPGSNPGPLYWEHGVLATGSPGKSPEVLFLNLGTGYSHYVHFEKM